MIKRFPGPTWTSSHRYGEGEKNIARRLVYYHIPKCASIWMREYTLRLSQATHDPWLATYFTEEPLDDYTKIIILRDPVARWLSVCPAKQKIQRMVPNTPQCDQLFDDLESWLSDEHLAPQSDFIQGLDFSNAVWFWVDQTLSAKMETFVRAHITDSVPAPEILNASPSDNDTKNAVKCWSALLEVPKYLDKFKQIYQRDYQLIDSIKFYGTN
jgi:hypothetical protein